MSRTLLIVALLFGLCLSAQGQTQGCTAGFKPVTDTFLQTAISELQKNHEDVSIRIIEKDYPCISVHSTIKNFSATLKKNYFGNNVKSHEMASIVRERLYFKVERFVFKNKKALLRLENSIKQQKYRDFAIKSPTYYDYFVFEDSIVFLIATGKSWEKNRSLIKEIERDFRVAAQVKQ